MKRDKMYLIAAGLLFVESLAGVVWGIQRGLSSLFAKEILMITSFTQIGMVTSVFGITKAITNLGMGALSDRVGRKPVIVVGGIVSALGGMVIASTNQFAGMHEAVLENRFRDQSRSIGLRHQCHVLGLNVGRISRVGCPVLSALF